MPEKIFLTKIILAQLVYTNQGKNKKTLAVQNKTVQKQRRLCGKIRGPRQEKCQGRAFNFVKISGKIPKMWYDNL
ncbi:MAG: hypothetical protein Q4C55_03065 [Eubacterium sp.]|nr:hypothetical protein [Eubacterium sp.]